MGGGDPNYEIHQNAYIKLILHALKHKTSAVNGVLLGRISGDSVEIVDSVPLFHSHIGLLPPLEISLIMAHVMVSGEGYKGRLIIELGAAIPQGFLNYKK